MSTPTIAILSMILGLGVASFLHSLGDWTRDARKRQAQAEAARIVEDATSAARRVGRGRPPAT
jgi:uncharacterized metal-binding protein